MRSRPGPSLAALLALGAVAGCVDTSEMFAGRWESTLAPHEGLVEGVPVLALGHFGQEVAGVAYFKREHPAGALYVEACPCSFVDHQAVDLDDRRLAFSTTCADPPQTLDWELKLIEGGSDLFLQGTVRAATGGDAALAVDLVLADEFVLEEERSCPPVDF